MPSDSVLNDIPITVIGGRGPHGLALHLWMRDRGLAGYRLLDPAPHWLPLYGPDGPMQAVTHLRSPRELDFSLGLGARAMRHFVDDDGSRSLERVYRLEEADNPEVNEFTTAEVRAPRLAFWRYANAVAGESGADAHVLQARVSRLEPQGEGWRVHLADGRAFATAAVILATGLMPHRLIPRPWRHWWDHLPEGCKAHALAWDYPKEELEGKRVAVLGSSNVATWEAAVLAAGRGARVTLLSRALNPIEWQLPFSSHWFTAEGMGAFMGLDAARRLRVLKRTYVPASSLPGMARRAYRAGVRVCHYARVRYASELWGGVQLHYKTLEGDVAERFDLLLAATGVSPRLKELPLLADVACAHKAPVVVSGPAKGRPILDDSGRWKNLPPLYPMGAHALMRAGLAANTLASATVYLPLTMPHILEQAGLFAPDLDIEKVA